jgi:acetyl esterase/lipase
MTPILTRKYLVFIGKTPYFLGNNYLLFPKKMYNWSIQAEVTRKMVDMKKIWLILSVIIVILIASTTSVYALQSSSIEKNVVFYRCQGKDVAMDLYYPRLAGAASPVVVYIHGGGWFSGDKATGIGLQEIPELNQRGYLVASINYRLAPRYAFPSQIEDVECAIRFLRANAGEYKIDSEHIGVYGESAGGHLASLLGVTNGVNWCCNPDSYPDQSTKVQAVVDMFGPSDLSLTFKQNWNMAIEHIFGTSDPESNLIKEASPVNYVSQDDPPFLIIHGSRDDQVLPDQSEELYQKLISNNVPASLLIVENCGHEFSPVGGPISPSRSEISSRIADFFDQYLK